MSGLSEGGSGGGSSGGGGGMNYSYFTLTACSQNLWEGASGLRFGSKVNSSGNTFPFDVELVAMSVNAIDPIDCDLIPLIDGVGQEAGRWTIAGTKAEIDISAAPVTIPAGAVMLFKSLNAVTSGAHNNWTFTFRTQGNG